jgi:pyruvate, orthophosphate dikinase
MTQYAPETLGAQSRQSGPNGRAGLPVPPAFSLPIDLCAAVVGGGKDACKEVAESLAEGIGFRTNYLGC